jgi:hypothetical protein
VKIGPTARGLGALSCLELLFAASFKIHSQIIIENRVLARFLIVNAWSSFTDVVLLRRHRHSYVLEDLSRNLAQSVAVLELLLSRTVVVVGSCIDEKGAQFVTVRGGFMNNLNRFADRIVELPEIATPFIKFFGYSVLGIWVYELLCECVDRGPDDDGGIERCLVIDLDMSGLCVHQVLNDSLGLGVCLVFQPT